MQENFSFVVANGFLGIRIYFKKKLVKCGYKPTSRNSVYPKLPFKNCNGNSRKLVKDQEKMLSKFV